MPSQYRDLYRRFSILPHDEGLYALSFTHSSYNGMVGTRHQDYERLEFLGDAVIGMVVSELCYKYHPDMEQGQLSMLKAQFIRSSAEAEYCKKLGLNTYIRVGFSFAKDASNNTSLLEDVFEAFIGAVYLDQGLVFTHRLVTSIFEEDIKNATVDMTINPKSYLQECMQADKKESVTYKILAETGASENKVFLAAVYFEGKEIGRGEGHNKKEAETSAAKDALSKMALPRKD